MDSSFYELDGVRYDRVTRILDFFATPGLVNWKVRVGKREAGRISREALKIGSKLHESVEAGKLVKRVTIDVKNCWEAYQKWLEEYQPVVEARETTLYDAELMVAGTPDLVTKEAVVDFKTSREIRPNYWLQAAMYAKMAGKGQLAVLRLDKNLAIFDYQVREQNERYVRAFTGLLEAYRYYCTEGETDDREDRSSTTHEEIHDRQEVAEPEVPHAWPVRHW